MTKRTYNRRSDEEIIADLEQQVAGLKRKIEDSNRSDLPILERLPKIKRTMTAFSQLCMDNGRRDMANTVLAFVNTLSEQAKKRG